MRRSFSPLQSLRGEMDRMLTDLVSRPQMAWASPITGFRGFPPINLWEEGDNLFLEAELPGVKADELEISAVGNELTLKGKREELEQEGWTYHRRERPTGSFVRVVTLPCDIDADKINASLEAGVLLLTLPKAEAAKPRKIQVQSK